MTAPPAASPEPGASRRARIFISYRSKEPDLGLAHRFFTALQDEGHHPFMAGESIRLGERWPARIDQALEQCDWFLLFLSPQAATSEMVTEEVRRVKALQEKRGGEWPALLPIRVNLPLDAPLNYDLAGYLNAFQQETWESESDTVRLLQEVLDLLKRKIPPPRPDPDEERGEPPIPIEEPGKPPLPIAAPELPEGQVSLASFFYVERPPIESDCFETVAQPGALIRIKAARQMGKTSLMARTLHHAASLDYLTVSLSFQLADGSIFSDLDNLLRWFCSAVTWKLKMRDRVADSWSIPGSKLRCTDYFESYLLAEIDRPLALALDEVDLVFQHLAVAADFFSMLRSWHEIAKNQEPWKRLRLIVVHSTEAYIPLNINESPFNVGLPIDLPDLTPAQVLDLARRHGLDWSSFEVDRLMAFVGGHPFLVRLAQYHLARGTLSLDELLIEGPTEAGLYGDHLKRHLWNLEQYPELAQAFRQVVSEDRPVRLDSDRAFKLDSMGLVRRSGNDVSPRFDLYTLYFRDRWRNRR